ncbi:sulfite exporter TauE/SafE family protein, partial [Roseibium hamelinense]|nr:sulfite exporter TauE/SafE family protein [Roseibium hamelinense]
WGDPALPAFSAGYVNLLGVALIIPVTTFAAPFGVKVAHAMPRRRMEVLFGLFLLVVAARFCLSLYE